MSFERKKLSDGNNNPKYIDLCDEDAPIAGQKFACFSFISPEKILKDIEEQEKNAPGNSAFKKTYTIGKIKEIMHSDEEVLAKIQMSKDFESQTKKLNIKDIYEKNLIKNLLNKIWNFINEYILGNKVIKSLSRKELNDRILDIVDDVFVGFVVSVGFVVFVVFSPT